MKAWLYETLDDKKVRCDLCRHRCIIRDGNRGICRVRENQHGILKTLVYGKLIAQQVDPIEKKPLFHFLPGSLSFSVATPGCNFKCLFCQNANISQLPMECNPSIMTNQCAPEKVVDTAIKKQCKSISYTYTEPTIYFEFAYDTAKLAHEKGLKNIFVTNGYMTADALKMISPYLDGANVDLKAFTEDFYKKQCGARLEPVIQTLKHMVSMGIFIEVTTLLIPGLNDGENELSELAGFIASSLGQDVPWHISRFNPTYKLTDRSSTPVKSLLTARQIGLKAGLRYVYIGNVPGGDGENTFCHSCEELLIERWGFFVKKYNIKNGCCVRCGEQAVGVGM